MNEQIIKEAIASIRETADTAIRSIQELTYDTYKVGEVEMSRGSEDRMECVWGNDVFNKGMDKLLKDTIYDWENIPDWINWVAMDDGDFNNRVWGYRTKPQLRPTILYMWDTSRENRECSLLPQTVIKKEVPWRKSLEKRPE